MRRRRLVGALAAVLAGGLVLSACAADEENDVADAPEDDQPAEEVDWGQCDTGEGAAEVPDPEGTGDDQTDLTIGIFSGWEESYATAHIFQHVLEDQGYSVEFTELEAAATFTGVSDGDIDFMTDVWLPLTHDNYIEEYGEDIQSLGCWYDTADLTFAVNEDAPIDSLEELAGNAEAFDNTIVGIEPGAGLTQQTEDEVIPTYGLEEMEFVTSSTPAMLAELSNAVDSGNDVLVTLWHPHFAYEEFPIRDLEDPENALGETEILYNFGREGFEQDYPNVEQMVRNMNMSEDQVARLVFLMFSEEEYAGENHEAAVADWIEENPEFVDDLKAGELTG